MNVQKNEIDRFNLAVEYLLNNQLVKNKTALAGVFGISKSKLSEILNRRMRPGFDLFNLLSEKFSFNPEWLLVGKGDMLKNTHLNDTKHSITEEPSLNIYKSRTDRTLTKQHIPLYDIEATAGLVELFDNGKGVAVDTISIPNLPKADGAVFVTGDSMYPLLKSGDIVIYKEIKDKRNEIFWGEMYLISVDVSGEEYIVIKYVQKSEKGEEYIKLVSYNQHHQPKDVLLDKVRGIALIKASIRFNSMN